MTIGERYRADGVPVLSLNPTQEVVRDRVLARLQSGTYRLEKTPCPLCESARDEVISEKDRYGLPMTVVICRSCGLVRSDPRMDAASSIRFYEQDYRPLYVGQELPPAWFFKKQRDEGIRIYHYLKRRTGVLQRHHPVVVDVGCGAGGMLEYFKNMGCLVAGIDLDERYLDYGRKVHDLPLRKTALEDFSTDEPADVIILNHVLEHMVDPIASLERLAGMLSTGGVLYVAVPGIRYLHRSYNMDLLLYLQNAHLFHFSMGTLVNTAWSAGLRPIVGDEVIQAIFTTGQKVVEPMYREYRAILDSLKRVERARRIYPIAPYKIFSTPRTIIRKSLRRVNLYSRVKDAVG